MSSRFLVWPVHVVCLLVVIQLVFIQAMHHCRPGKFHDKKLHRCRPCSRCPDHLIVLAICRDHNNTVCGPFRDFMFGNYDKNLQKNHNATVQSAPTEHEVHLVAPNEEAYWKNLAFAIIGVLCSLILITVMVVVGTWQHFRRSGRMKYTYNCDSDTDSDNPYVVVRTIRHLSSQSETSNGSTIPQAPENLHLLMRQRQRLLRAYHPKRRLLTEYVDDVFESEDSAGSKTDQRMTLQTIPEGDQSENDSRNGSRSSRSPNNAESPGSQISPQHEIMDPLLHIDENCL